MLFLLSLLLFFTHFGSVNAMRTQPDALAQTQAAKRKALEEKNTVENKGVTEKKEISEEKPSKKRFVGPLNLPNQQEKWWQTFAQIVCSSTLPSHSRHITHVDHFSLGLQLAAIRGPLTHHLTSTSATVTPLIMQRAQNRHALCVSYNEDDEEEAVTPLHATKSQ